MPTADKTAKDEAVITIRNLTRYYGARVGVHSMNCDITEGEIFGFLGPNGAGKTTAIRLLLGFLRPSNGRAAIFGRDCWKHRARILRDVGYLPGDLRLYPWMTGHKPLRISGLIRRLDLRSAGRDLSDRFRLEMDLSVHKMSRGMRQKLGLILALAHKPKLLVLDEPTGGLDPLIQAELADHLRELASVGHTVFFSSHTLSEVQQLCSRIAIVRNGRIVTDETLESLRNRARRAVKLVFPDNETATTISPPAFLNLTSAQGRYWDAELTGSSSELIRWAAEQPLVDIEISPPNLENLFRKFYRSSEDTE